MAVPFSVANAAYGQTQKLLSGAQGAPAIPGKDSSGGGQDFGAMLSESLQQVAQTGARSDKISTDMINGKANVVDMVTAVSQTELAIDSLVTVRDKVISAYEEIMRMPI